MQELQQIRHKIWELCLDSTIPVAATFSGGNGIPIPIGAVVVEEVSPLHILQSRDLLLRQVLVPWCTPPSVHRTRSASTDVVVHHSATVYAESLERRNERRTVPVDRVLASLRRPRAPVPQTRVNSHRLRVGKRYSQYLIVPEHADRCIVHKESAGKKNGHTDRPDFKSLIDHKELLDDSLVCLCENCVTRSCMRTLLCVCRDENVCSFCLMCRSLRRDRRANSSWMGLRWSSAHGGCCASDQLLTWWFLLSSGRSKCGTLEWGRTTGWSAALDPQLLGRTHLFAVCKVARLRCLGTRSPIRRDDLLRMRAAARMHAPTHACRLDKELLQRFTRSSWMIPLWENCLALPPRIDQD